MKSHPNQKIKKEDKKLLILLTFATLFESMDDESLEYSETKSVRKAWKKELKKDD